MSTTFGYDIATGGVNDRYVDLAEHILAVIPELLQPGRNMINVFPFLRFIPPWIPGASTQKSMVKVKELWMAYKTEPYEYVKSNLVYISTFSMFAPAENSRSSQGHRRIAY